MTDGPSLLVAAHGFARERDRVHPAREHARRLRGTERFDEIRAGFVTGEPTIEEQVRSTRGDRLVVVPLFVSDGYFVGTRLPECVENTCPAGVAVEYADPVGTHEWMTDVIMRRALSTAGSRSETVGIALFGHGSEYSSRNRETVRKHARRIRNRGKFAEVRSYFVEEEPTGDEVPAEFSVPEVVVIPVFVASGTHVREDIPEQVGFSGRGGTVGGTEITYAKPVGTDLLVAGIIFERAVATLGEAADGGISVTGTTRIQEWRQKQ